MEAGNPTVAAKFINRKYKPKNEQHPKNTLGLDVVTVAEQQEREQKEPPGEQNNTTKSHSNRNTKQN